MVGSGLAIFSKHPIVASYFHKFLVNGAPWRFTQGDWYSAKGVGMVAVRVQQLHFAVFNMHIHAEYDSKRTSTLGTRIVQLWEARRFIDAMCCNYDAVIVGGDFNTLPEELAFEAFFVHDVGFRKHLHDAGKGLHLPTASVDGARPKRIDYILTHNIHCTSYGTLNVSMNEMLLSDHALLTVCLDFNYNECEPCKRKDCTDKPEHAAIISSLKCVLGKDLKKRTRQRTTFLVIWVALILASLGFGAYAVVTVYIANYPKTISLLLYVLFPIVVVASDVFFFLWMFARGDAQVFSRVINEMWRLCIITKHDWSRGCIWLVRSSLYGA